MSGNGDDESDARVVRVGLLGSGNVGAAVIRLLHERGDDVARRAGVRLEVTRVAVRDAGRARDLPIAADRFTDDPSAVVDDPGLDVVCELIGGVERFFGTSAAAPSTPSRCGSNRSATRPGSITT